jgi:hypothetical protein
MNIFQRIVLVLGAIVLVAAIVTTPQVVLVQGSYAKPSADLLTRFMLQPIIAPATAIIRFVAVLSLTVLGFLALQGVPAPDVMSNFFSMKGRYNGAMNIFQRIVLVLGAIALVAAIVTTPQLVILQGSYLKTSADIADQLQPMIALATALIRSAAVIGVTALLFFALKGDTKRRPEKAKPKK